MASSPWSGAEVESRVKSSERVALSDDGSCRSDLVGVAKPLDLA